MVKEQCLPFYENIPAYAIGALDADEASALEAHLKTCADCQAELASYRAISNNLLVAMPPQLPPASIRANLQRRFSDEARTKAHPRLAWSLNQLAVTGLAIVLVILNVSLLLQVQSLQRSQIQISQQLMDGQTAMAMLAYPETRTIPIEGDKISGTVLLNKDQNMAMLIIWNLPRLNADQTYQAWLIDPQGGRTSAKIFDADASLPFTTVTIPAVSNLSQFVGIGITVEPQGGSNQPTGQRVFKIDY